MMTGHISSITSKLLQVNVVSGTISDFIISAIPPTTSNGPQVWLSCCKTSNQQSNGRQLDTLTYGPSVLIKEAYQKYIYLIEKMFW